MLPERTVGIGWPAESANPPSPRLFSAPLNLEFSFVQYIFFFFSPKFIEKDVLSVFDLRENDGWNSLCAEASLPRCLQLGRLCWMVRLF